MNNSFNYKDKYIQQLASENKYLRQKLKSIELTERVTREFVNFIKNQEPSLNEVQEEIVNQTNLENFIRSCFSEPREMANKMFENPEFRPRSSENNDEDLS